MFIIMCGDVDMGNGYSIGLVNVIVGIWLTGNPLVGFLGLVIFVGLYMALAALIKIRQIPAIVVTMGAQFVWYGLALIICPTPGGKCPQWLSDFLRIKTPVIPLPIIIAVVTGLACWYLLYRCRYGIVLRGAGNNVQALERSGWSYLLAKVVAYGIAGFFVVLAGMTYTNTCNGADANSSVNYNMMSIATVNSWRLRYGRRTSGSGGSRYGSDRYESDQFAFNCHEDEFELSDCYHRTYPDRSSCLKVPDS